MAVTALATIVNALAGDITRPGYTGATNMGWNNRVGDPSWISDYDYYRRVQLVAQGTLGEVGAVVNWELYDDTVPFKTPTDITNATAGAAASPYGTVINHTGTWTVWATTGVATATAPKYYDTKRAAISRLRANGPRVQLLLGDRKKVTGSATTWTIAAFLPGAGKIPSATTTFVVTPPTVGVMPPASPFMAGNDGVPEAQLRALEAKEEKARKKKEKKVSTSETPEQIPVVEAPKDQPDTPEQLPVFPPDEGKPPKEDNPNKPVKEEKPPKEDKPPKKPEPKGGIA